MNALSVRDRELVALGAALASNCVPCLESHVPAARRAGLGDAEIAEAIPIADKIRRVPAGKALEAAHAQLAADGAFAAESAADACCAPASLPGRPCC